MSGMVSVVVALLACSRASAPTAGPFDGQKAWEYAKAQVDFGPRVPGTAAHDKAGAWIIEQMRQRADTVIEQRWTHVTTKGDSLPLLNVLARFRPDAGERVLYVTHWDTRPISDQETDSARRKLPIPGANDGASGVGLFIALGDLLKRIPPSVGVDLLFVDGEDYGEFGPPEVDVLLGSKYFAEHLPSPDYRILYGVLWDMIGDSDLQIYQETNSSEQAPEVVNRVWQTAADLGLTKWFIPQQKWAVTDDHIPLLKKGLRVIDVIDLDYAAHHTQGDTMDKISAQSLKVVGDVAYALVK
jgi:Zn-dependent M28 family amino/carboxypeptidase